jgi:hypothetical protein
MDPLDPTMEMEGMSINVASYTHLCHEPHFFGVSEARPSLTK